MVYRGPGGVNVVINPYFCGKLMEMVLRAALLQMDIEWGKPAANRAVAGRLVRALHDTDIAFLPEMFTTGFMAADTALAEPMEGPSVEWMRCTAAETGIALAGSLIIGDGRERPYNRFVFAFPDGRIDWYDKRHLFSFSGEDTLYAPGCVRVVLEYKGFRILPMVCYDLRFPVWSRARSDYDVAVYAASWPQARIGAWDALLRARAIENQCYVLGINRVGSDPSAFYDGHSVAVDFFGNVMGRLAEGEAGVIRTELDHERLDAYRERFRAWEDADRFTLTVWRVPFSFGRLLRQKSCGNKIVSLHV